MIKTYIEPQQSSKSKIVFSLISSILWTYMISYAYGVIIAFSPFVYINLFITIGFAFLIGFGVRVLSKLFSITQKKTSILIALICGILGLYFSWVVYILYFQADASSFDSYFIEPFLLFTPLTVFQIIADINQVGLWEIFGIPFNGWVLSLIWFLEAVIIVLTPTLLVKSQPKAPYSERHNKWYKKYVLLKDFESIVMQEKFINELASNCTDVLDSMGNGLAYHFARVSIYLLEEESEQYLSVENVQKDRQGKNESTSEVIHLLSITTPEAKNLIDKYHGKKAFVFDY